MNRFSVPTQGSRSTHFYGGSRWFLGLICFCVFWLMVVLFEAQERSEKLAVELTIRSMQIGLKVAMAEAIVQGREAELGRWKGSNPIRWLGSTPESYRGDCSKREAEEMSRGNWCYDRESRELAYRPRFGWHLRLVGEGNQGRILRWRVGGSANLQQNPAYLGVNVQLVTPYVWFGD